MNFVIAAALLTTPPNIVMDDVDDSLKPAVIQLAIEWEILDDREARYGIDSDTLNLLRQRYIHLRNAPRICEADRLPSVETAKEWIAFNRLYNAWMEDISACRPELAEEMRHRIAENDTLHEIWVNILDARTSMFGTPFRRAALMKIPEEIPPGVAQWRFVDEW